MTNEELAAKMDENSARTDERLSGIDKHLARIDQRFDDLEKRVTDGFDASKARDEELRDLTKFGLEAREVLRDEMHRRFDEADGKNDQRIALLTDAVRHLTSRR